jgi:hypothetical protein
MGKCGIGITGNVLKLCAARAHNLACRKGARESKREKQQTGIKAQECSHEEEEQKKRRL